MPYYVQRGTVPHKRHTQFRKPDGSLYHEQLFGTKGFSGVSSLIYHLYPPTQVSEFKFMWDIAPGYIEDDSLSHRHLKTAGFEAHGDPISGRAVLMGNEDVTLGFCKPIEPMDYFYKNADGDDLLFVQSGNGHIETMFGTLEFESGDYIVIPRGTIYRIVAEIDAVQFVVIEAPCAIEPPSRYRNEYGQLLEHSPYCERDIRVPNSLVTHDQSGRYEIRIKARGKLNSFIYEHHPLDVVGWDGFVYPFAFNIRDFEPITGSVHQPPPVHQTFEGHNFVVCSFVPRMLDYHPDAVVVPYNHSNLESDEVLFYCNDKFGSRKGIEVGSITLHPSGLPHGPQPGAVEASIGKTRTEELAVMVDTFRPLRLTNAALEIEDDSYPFSWK